MCVYAVCVFVSVCMYAVCVCVCECMLCVCVCVFCCVHVGMCAVCSRAITHLSHIIMYMHFCR